MIGWLFAGGVAFLLLKNASSSQPQSTKAPGPFDETPAGTDRAPYSQQLTTGQFSGRSYRATMYRNVQGEKLFTYSVLVDVDTDEWIGWLWHQNTNARLFWRGAAKNADSLTEMKKDFGV